ncbi:hypothetical protein CcaverHIS002_0211350 [Cutaneotrichosporon cavernicola]|uniref:Uncharacterized protein n=1 Tax=Cutaneotrichosporon cavernicola TaxID=279322 RepID=A0AA48I5N4_9TREE|nr:uncharacterized protein CcaverHIS019_0211340 [Cutaneotrichosporon cavernicola]BEI81975.1 hypothetical protein CcaverHIS002_0211350 [Cutaneotrichosporon cavernicola]BEI89772.1 hypothetical protein CcaverHIS019_0211340 [Cutaneotrichosporon cavernicola]BEI97544.1 hypothetical protein CcaverHIS631_0211330 [Cutaneotrichosporon cavernicola]BEJ05322.1 hypothetical protein CcaverHIS641_0211390 [Cutaneotrichosporon cavernicola]
MEYHLLNTIFAPPTMGYNMDYNVDYNLTDSESTFTFVSIDDSFDHYEWSEFTEDTMVNEEAAQDYAPIAQDYAPILLTSALDAAAGALPTLARNLRFAADRLRTFDQESALTSPHDALRASCEKLLARCHRFGLAGAALTLMWVVGWIVFAASAPNLDGGDVVLILGITGGAMIMGFMMLLILLLVMLVMLLVAVLLSTVAAVLVLCSERLQNEW